MLRVVKNQTLTGFGERSFQVIGDLRATWAVTLAAGLLWRVEHGWTVADCLRWLDSHGFLYHQRTLEHLETPLNRIFGGYDIMATHKRGG